MDVKQAIQGGNTKLSIELGTTRIKSMLVGSDNSPIASGIHEWENQQENGLWIYHLDDVWNGLQDSYKKLKLEVKGGFGLDIATTGSIGISAMMHGYMVFDKNGGQLVSFRTWRNTIAEKAAAELTALFKCNVPQCWSIAHLYQAMLNKEQHLPEIDLMTTLAGYVHWKLTGEKVVGVTDASGIFPLDSGTSSYDTRMLGQFDELVSGYGVPWKLANILPRVLKAGEKAGGLSTIGARMLDISGTLKAGIPFSAPEGNAEIN